MRGRSSSAFNVCGVCLKKQRVPCSWNTAWGTSTGNSKTAWTHAEPPVYQPADLGIFHITYNRILFHFISFLFPGVISYLAADSRAAPSDGKHWNRFVLMKALKWNKALNFLWPSPSLCISNPRKRKITNQTARPGPAFTQNSQRGLLSLRLAHF